MAELIDPMNLLTEVREGRAEVVRQSTLNQLDVCGMRVAYDRSPDATYGSGSARAVGTGYHAGLEHFFEEWFGQHIDHRVIVEAVEAAIESYLDEVRRSGDAFVLDEGESHNENEGKIRDMVTGYLTGGHAPSPAEWKVLATELEFAVPGPGQNTVAKGTVDLVLQSIAHPEHLRMEDHKTAGRMWAKGKEHPRKHVQFPFYFRYAKTLIEQWVSNKAVWGPGQFTWSATYAIMTYKGKFERRIATPTAVHEALIESKATWALGLIGTGYLLPNPSSNLCSPKYCDHWDICPWGEAGMAT